MCMWHYQTFLAECDITWLDPLNKVAPLHDEKKLLGFSALVHWILYDANTCINLSRVYAVRDFTWARVSDVHHGPATWYHHRDGTCISMGWGLKDCSLGLESLDPTMCLCWTLPTPNVFYHKIKHSRYGEKGL